MDKAEYQQIMQELANAANRPLPQLPPSQKEGMQAASARIAELEAEVARLKASPFDIFAANTDADRAQAYKAFFGTEMPDSMKADKPDEFPANALKWSV